MTERKLPDLAELGRKEREVAERPDPTRTEEEVFVFTQLRPLLELVDRMGTAFAPLICKSAPTEAEVNAAITVLAEYQRAKGGSP